MADVDIEIVDGVNFSEDAETCQVHPTLKNLFHHCHSDSGVTTEDNADYSLGWSTYGVDLNDRNEYRYTSWKELNGLPLSGLLDTYSGSGYVWKLTQPTLQCCEREDDIETMSERMVKLQKENWIDHNTRAIFVEFSLFNPAVSQRFCLNIDYLCL